MLDFIQNPWVIGIVGGVICGIIVWLLTRCAISSKGNNEYIKKVYQANDEVFLSLKPYIADKGLPDQEIIEAMIASTARKYLLKASDMYTVQIFCEELIKDITSNVYFSWEEKKRYSNDLRTFIEDLNRQTDKKTAAEIDAKVNDIEHKKRMSEIKRKDLNTVSMIAGLFTAVVTLVLALMANSFFPSAEGYNSFVLYTVLAVILCGIVSSGALLLFTKVHIVGRRKRAAKEKRNAIVVDVDEGNDNWIE